MITQKDLQTEPDTDTQLKMLRAAFLRGERLTMIDMLNKYGVGNHTGRICDLRHHRTDPLPIEMDYVRNGKKRYGVYYLKTKEK